MPLRTRDPTLGGGHGWTCYIPGHTAECFQQADPNNGTTWIPSLPTSLFSGTAEGDYGIFVPSVGNYYVWVCGKGGTGDNTVHVAGDFSLTSTSANLSGFTGSWSWRSTQIAGSRPYITLTSSIVGSTLINRIINVLMRDDGFAYDRILLTRDFNYNPNGIIRCGAGY